MAEREIDQAFGEGRSKLLKEFLGGLLPEARVFIRRADGRSTHLTISRRLQWTALVGAIVLSAWAGSATTLLVNQPEALAAKERELDLALDEAKGVQQRLAAAEKMVADITREVDGVHSNLVALTETSDSLVKDRPRAKAAPLPARGRVAGSEDDEQGRETRAVREQVRQLEASLERLHQAYAQAMQQTAQAADTRIAETQQQLSRLGLDPSRLMAPVKRSPGQGGPFIPVGMSSPATGDSAQLMERVQQWNGMKAALQRLPLALPLRTDFEFNSGFGTRNDPLNNRTGMHEGIDLGAPIGTPVYATGDGVVTLARDWDRYGNMIEVAHGNGIVTRYAHLSRIKVKEGQRVSRATVIGLLGTTGRSTGPHLHYEIRVAEAPRDPIRFISVGRDAQQIR